MLPDRVSNPGPLTYESGALPIALRGPAFPNSTTQFRTERPKVRLARTFLIKIGYVSLIGHELIPQGLFLINRGYFLFGGEY